MGTEISLGQEVELKSDDSDVTVHSTIFHCGRKDTKVPSIIQGYEAIIKRSKKAKSNLVLFNVEGKVY